MIIKVTDLLEFIFDFLINFHVFLGTLLHKSSYFLFKGNLLFFIAIQRISIDKRVFDWRFISLFVVVCVNVIVNQVLCLVSSGNSSFLSNHFSRRIWVNVDAFVFELKIGSSMGCLIVILGLLINGVWGLCLLMTIHSFIFWVEI